MDVGEAEQNFRYPDNRNLWLERKIKKMMQFPPPDPRRYEAEAKLKIREQERKRDLNLSRGDTSETAQRNRLSRRAYVLIQLTVILLIIVGMVVLYHFLH